MFGWTGEERVGKGEGQMRGRNHREHFPCTRLNVERVSGRDPY